MSAFTTSGAVPIGSLYVKRGADDDLSARLMRFEYCYLLAPRMIGKSSLRLRTALLLREQGYHVATIDCQSLAGEQDISRVWNSFGENLYEDLIEHGVQVPAWGTWAGANHSANSWTRYLREVVIPASPKGLILFIEEVDYLKSLRCDTDGILSTLRLLHSQRSDRAVYRRLGLCLIGVTRTADLVRNPEISPFNVAQAIPLSDFTREEADAFLPALKEVFAHPERILEEAYAWTSGHPYMLQVVLERVVNSRQSKAAQEDPSLDAPRVRTFLEGIVRGDEGLLSPQKEDTNLGAARRQFDTPILTPEQLDALNQYRLVISNKSIPVSDGSGREVQELLRIAGMVSFETRDGRAYLSVRNRVFRERFSRAWVMKLVDRRSYDDLAVRWEASDEHPDYLLQGKALAEAEAWLKEQEREVSSLTSEFILAARTVKRQQLHSKRLSQALWLLPSIVTLVVTLFVAKQAIERSEAERESMQLLINTLVAQQAASKESLRRNENELSTLRDEKDRISGELKSKNASLTRLEKRRDELQTQLQNDAKTRKEIQRQLNDVNRDIRQALDERSRLETNLDTANQRTLLLTALTERLNRDLENTTRTLGDTRAELASAKAAQQSLRAQLANAVDAQQGLINQLNKLQAQVTELSSKAQELQANYDTCSSQLASAKTDLDKSRHEAASCVSRLEQVQAAQP